MGLHPAPCRYCSGTGLSVVATADMARVICDMCDVGNNLQEFLMLFAKLPPQAHQEVVEFLQKRIVEI